MTPIGRKHSRRGLLLISGDILGDLEEVVDLCDALIGSGANRIELAAIRQTENLENARSSLKTTDGGKGRGGQYLDIYAGLAGAGCDEKALGVERGRGRHDKTDRRRS